ncbi:MAG: hypothetical protein Q8N04_10785 [Nitrospira sp.]|nr:hypothetical protein [Nitrospira sp.]
MTSIKMFRYLGVVAASWVLGTSPVYATTLISEDFEGSAASIAARWPGQSYCCFPNSGGPFNLVPSPVAGGAQALRYNYTGSQYDNPPQGGGSAEWDYTDQTQREVWITWYSYMAPGFKTAGGNGVGGVATKGIYQYMKSLSNGQVNGWVFHYFYGGRQLTLSAQGIKDHKGPNGPGTGTAIPYDTENMWQNVQSYEQPDGQWVGYEARFKLNTPGQADGAYQLYITPPGSTAFLAASHTNREFVDTTPGGRMPSDARWYRTKLYRQDGLGSMYIDNLTVTTTRVGFSGVPLPPSDTTPPATPSGFTAR